MEEQRLGGALEVQSCVKAAPVIPLEWSSRRRIVKLFCQAEFLICSRGACRDKSLVAPDIDAIVPQLNAGINR